MDTRTIDERREYLVVKSNELIQQTKKELNPVQLDFIDTVISKISPDDDRNKVYTISVDEFCKLKGINTSNNISYIKKQVDVIDDKKMYIKNDKGKLVRIRWFDVLRIVLGDSTIEYSFSEDIKDFVFQLHKSGNYTQYRLSNSIVLKSQYSKYIYQYLKCWENRGYDRISIEHFIKFECPCPYKEFKDLKRRVLEPAMKEINRFTDITVNYQPIKAKGSRKYTELYFTIKTNTPLVNLYHAENRKKALDGAENPELEGVWL